MKEKKPLFFTTLKEQKQVIFIPQAVWELSQHGVDMMWVELKNNQRLPKTTNQDPLPTPTFTSRADWQKLLGKNCLRFDRRLQRVTFVHEGWVFIVNFRIFWVHVPTTLPPRVKGKKHDDDTMSVSTTVTTRMNEVEQSRPSIVECEIFEIERVWTPSKFKQVVQRVAKKLSDGYTVTAETVEDILSLDKKL